jgi:glycerol uptake facilitator protein
MDIIISELVGTFLLILLGNGVVANVVLNQTKGQNSGWIVITFGWAIAVYIGILASAKSGAHLNPAFSVAALIKGSIDFSQFISYAIGQLSGAFLGACAVFLVYSDHYSVTSDAGGKLATFSTGPAIRNTFNNLISEIVGTFVLVFAIFCIPSATTDLGGLNPLPVALIVLSVGLSLGGTTGYAINPARDLGPRLAHSILPIPGKGSSDFSYGWIPVVGPILGAVLAALLHNALA